MSEQRNPREAQFREVRDEETGRFIARYNPATGELTRPERGRVLRGNLTDAGQVGYTQERKPQSG